ncbi:MAG: hypothetical protein AAF628_15275 [Planctomycetota bacterium]
MVALAWLAIVVAAHSVDVPRGDEWLMQGELLRAWHAGNITADTLFRQWNESRPALPQLWLTFVAVVTGWRVQVLHWQNVAVLALTGLLVRQTLLHTAATTGAPRSGPTRRLWQGLGAVTVVTALSAAHWRNLLWGVQLIVLLGPLCVTAGLLHNARSANSPWRCSLVTATLSLVATYSYANGMSAWLLLWPGWPRLIRGGRVCHPSDLLYGVTAIAALTAYFADYRSPETFAGAGYALSHPQQSIPAFALWFLQPLIATEGLTNERLGLLAGPWITRVVQAAIYGLAALLPAIAIWRLRAAARTPRAWLAAYPWLGLVAYGSMAGVATTLGRADPDTGILCAFADRYTTFGITTHVGLLGLAFALLGARPSETAPPRGIGSLLAAYATALLLANGFAWTAAAEDRHQQEQARLAIEAIPVLGENPMLERTLAPRAVVAETYATLRGRGYFASFRGSEWLSTTVDSAGDLPATLTRRPRRWRIGERLTLTFVAPATTPIEAVLATGAAADPPMAPSNRILRVDRLETAEAATSATWTVGGTFFAGELPEEARYYAVPRGGLPLRPLSVTRR